MFDEPFAHGRSLVHAVDPRFRLVAAFVCAVCLAVVRTPEAAWFGGFWTRSWASARWATC